MADGHPPEITQTSDEPGKVTVQHVAAKHNIAWRTNVDHRPQSPEVDGFALKSVAEAGQYANLEYATLKDWISVS